MERFSVGVVGTGYVGLATGASMAHVGHRVTCLDDNEERVASLKRGRIPFYEPSLEELLVKSSPRLRFVGSEGLSELVRTSDVLFVAVGTPQHTDGSADLSHVADVARGIGRGLVHRASDPARCERQLVVANKSTVPVGTANQVSALIRAGIAEAGGAGADFRVASNPEFLREGSAVYDSLFPDRVVVGADSRETLDTLRALYAPIVEQSFPTSLDPRPKVAVPFVPTDVASAEMIKYASNAYLATKISLINEVADLCELVGADVLEVAHGVGLDSRVGARFLSAGIGWGGSCLPKDVAALRATARRYKHETPLLDATVAVNNRRCSRVIEKLERDLRSLDGKRVALLGLSFKPNTDDLREAPSLEIARALSSLGTTVTGYDPVSGKDAAQRLPSVEVVFDPYAALEGAHAAVVVTEWEDIKGLDAKKVASLMEEPRLLVDGRNCLDSAALQNAGILYRGFGRGLDSG